MRAPQCGWPASAQRKRAASQVIPTRCHSWLALALAKTLAAKRDDGETIAIVGVLEDKDVDGVITPLLGQVDRWIAMTADSHRAIAANELARRISNLSGRACLVAENTAAAIKLARRTASENDRILVTGSFSTVSPVLDQLATLSRTKP